MSLERKCENCFLLLSPSKVDRFTWNQDQNDHRPIIHMSSNTHKYSNLLTAQKL